MKFTSVTCATLISVVLAAPAPPYHYEVNVTASLNGKAFLNDTPVIIDQGKGLAITLGPTSYNAFKDALLHDTPLRPSSDNQVTTYKCDLAHDAQFVFEIDDKTFHATAKDFSTPSKERDPSAPADQCDLWVWYGVEEADYFGLDFINKVLHGERLPGTDL